MQAFTSSIIIRSPSSKALTSCRWSTLLEKDNTWTKDFSLNWRCFETYIATFKYTMWPLFWMSFFEQFFAAAPIPFPFTRKRTSNNLNTTVKNWSWSQQSSTPSIIFLISKNVWKFYIGTVYCVLCTVYCVLCTVYCVPGTWYVTPWPWRVQAACLCVDLFHLKPAFNGRFWRTRPRSRNEKREEPYRLPALMVDRWTDFAKSLVYHLPHSMRLNEYLTRF